MLTITIPKNLIAKDEELVIIPRKEYEEFLRLKTPQKQNLNVTVKRSPSFRVPKRLEKFYDEVDKELTEALREVEEGKVSGPFETANELIHFLRRKRK